MTIYKMRMDTLFPNSFCATAKLTCSSWLFVSDTAIRPEMKNKELENKEVENKETKNKAEDENISEEELEEDESKGILTIDYLVFRHNWLVLYPRCEKLVKHFNTLNKMFQKTIDKIDELPLNTHGLW